VSGSGRLVIVTPSPALQHRVEQAWNVLRDCMTPEEAATATRRTIVAAVDVGSHAGFAWSAFEPAPEDPVSAVGELLLERAEQGADPGALTREPIGLVVLAAGRFSLLGVLAHELAHILCGHPFGAQSLDPELEADREREAEERAARWLANDPRWRGIQREDA
jgi:hypothetical protein